MFARLYFKIVCYFAILLIKAVADQTYIHFLLPHSDTDPMFGVVDGNHLPFLKLQIATIDTIIIA